VTRALPFTAASLSRAIRGVEQAGLHVIGVRPCGTLIVSAKPVEATSIVPDVEQPSKPARRRIGEKIHGGQGAA
jgi:hypothetical protein